MSNAKTAKGGENQITATVVIDGQTPVTVSSRSKWGWMLKQILQLEADHATAFIGCKTTEADKAFYAVMRAQDLAKELTRKAAVEAYGQLPFAYHYKIISVNIEA